MPARPVVLRLLAALVVLAGTAGVAGCGGSGGSEPTEEANAATTEPAASATTTTRPSPTAPATVAPTPPGVPPVPVTEDPDAARAAVTPTGVLVPVESPTPAGFVVSTPCGGQVEVVGATTIATADVVLDPGHGGDEEGALGADELKEKEVNLDVARRAAWALHDRGFDVVLTRTDDYRITLATRAAIVTALQPRAFVSIHHNAVADGPSDDPGTETFHQYGSEESRRLAGLVYEEVFAAFAAFDVAWEADTDAGAKYRLSAAGDDYYGILRRTAGVPAVLSEAAYLSNPEEARLLADPAVRQTEAEALADAVERFLTTDDPGRGFVEPYARTDPAGPGGGAGGCVDPPLG